MDSTSFESVFRSKQENNDQYEKVLNILFQYNGETWDAYEVLGLPAGSSAEAAQKAYEACISKQPESAAFFKAACDAIIHKTATQSC